MIRALGADQRVNAACGAEQTSARTCVATRAVRAPEDLVRFVVGPEGDIVPDIAHKLPGRGIWVTCQRDTVENAVKKGAFQIAIAGQRFAVQYELEWRESWSIQGKGDQTCHGGPCKQFSGDPAPFGVWDLMAEASPHHGKRMVNRDTFLGKFMQMARQIPRGHLDRVSQQSAGDRTTGMLTVAHTALTSLHRPQVRETRVRTYV